MGGGGASGDVRFPPYIEDAHASLYAGEETDASTGRFLTSSWTKPTNDVTALLNTLWGTNPYSTFGWTDPAIDLAASKSQFDLFFNAVTGYDRSNYASYIADAILAIGNSTTVPIAELSYSLSTSALSTPQALYPTYAGVGRTQAASGLTSMFSAVQPDVRLLIPDAASVAIAAANLQTAAASTLWISLVTTVSSKLSQCNIPKNANLLSILAKAAQDAETSLGNAITIAKRFISDGLLQDVITQFSARREVTFANQHRQYAGQMADINAINSTGFLFGTALLRAEQMREVSEFDANLSLSQFNQGIATYVRIHADALTAGLSVEQQNAQAHNRLLESSIQLLSGLTLRGEVLPSELVRMYGQFFVSELGMFDSNLRDATGNSTRLFSLFSGDQLERDSQLARFSLEADRVNKLAKEQRYTTGLNQIQQLITNRTEFERIAAGLLTEQNRIKIVATDEFDSHINDTEVEEDLWDITVARLAADIMVAPGGMSAAIPKKPSKGASALGGALQGAGTGAAIAGPYGAVAGAIVGGVGGLLQ